MHSFGVLLVLASTLGWADPQGDWTGHQILRRRDARASDPRTMILLIDTRAEDDRARGNLDRDEELILLDAIRARPEANEIAVVRGVENAEISSSLAEVMRDQEISLEMLIVLSTVPPNRQIERSTCHCK